MAKFNMTYVDAMRCTPRQFEIEMIAYRLRRQEIELNNRLNAYYTMAVQSTKNNGKEMLYKNFNDFYDVEEEFEQALRPNTKTKRNNNIKPLSMAEINRRLSMKKGGTNG